MIQSIPLIVIAVSTLLSLIIGSIGIYLLTSLGWSMLYASMFLFLIATALTYLVRTRG